LSTFQRRPLFVNPDIIAAVRGEILRAAEREGIEISAYCFMPDHLHLVVRGCRAKASLVAFVKRAKQASGHWYRRVSGQRLWQVGYFERVLRDGDEHRAAVRYALDNPCRGQVGHLGGSISIQRHPNRVGPTFRSGVVE
jgi:putative transposase